MGRPAGQKRTPPRSKVMLLLRMMDCADGDIDATDSHGQLLNYFCGDYEPTDTFNRAIQLKFIRTEHSDIYESSRAFLTDLGMAKLKEYAQ